MYTEQNNHGKTERISIRLASEIKQKIEAAAAIDHRSITSFIIASAIASADKTLKQKERMVLSKQDWDIFYDALLNPPKPNKALKNAFSDYHKMKIQSDI